MGYGSFSGPKKVMPTSSRFSYSTWKGLSVFARTSASHLRVVPGGTVERMTRMGARPEDCSISFTTSGMVDHTYCQEGEREKRNKRKREKSAQTIFFCVTFSGTSVSMTVGKRPIRKKNKSFCLHQEKYSIEQKKYTGTRYAEMWIPTVVTS